MQSKECIDTELLLDTLLATSFSPSVSQTLSSSYPIGITELLLDTLLATSFSPSVSQTLSSSYPIGMQTFSISQENQIAKLYFFFILTKMSSVTCGISKTFIKRK